MMMRFFVIGGIFKLINAFFYTFEGAKIGILTGKTDEMRVKLREKALFLRKNFVENTSFVTFVP
jgi:hypothetical protein